MNKLRGFLALLVFLIMIIVNCGSVGIASTDERGKVYASGSSINDGSTHHDNIHSTVSGDDITNSYEYWFDQYMLNDYGIQTNLSAWYTNQSYASSWDKYNIGTGGGQTNNNGGEGNCAAYPYCCHCPPTKVADGEDAMYMACIPAQIDGYYGRAIWRYKSTDWSDVNYFIAEAGINEANDHGYFSDVGGEAYAQHMIRGSVWSGMNGIYNRSITYGFTFVLLKTLPCAAAYGTIYIDIVNEEKDKFASLHPDVIYVDTFNTSAVIWTVPYTSWAYNPAYFEADGVHPNKAGYQLMAQTIVDELAPHILALPEYEDLEFISIDGGVNGTIVYNSTPTFIWTEIQDASYYTLQISTTPTFASLVVNITKIDEYEWPSNCVISDSEVSFVLPDAYALAKGIYYCRIDVCE